MSKRQILLGCPKCGLNFSSDGAYYAHIKGGSCGQTGTLMKTASPASLESALASGHSSLDLKRGDSAMKALKADAMAAGVKHIDQLDTPEKLMAAIAEAKAAKSAPQAPAASGSVPAPTPEELAAKEKAAAEEIAKNALALEALLKSLRVKAKLLGVRGTKEINDPAALEKLIADAKAAKAQASANGAPKE